MNTITKLNAAKNLLKKAEQLAVAYPALSALTFDLSSWRDRVAELEQELSEENNKDGIMNTEKALSEARVILARKEYLSTRYPQSYSLKLDIGTWRSRVEEFESQLKEEENEPKETEQEYTN